MNIGPMLFIHHEDPDHQVVVNVTKCTDLRLSDAAALIGREEEWPDAVMLKGMRAIYPEIQLDSIVQVIEFDAPDSGVGA